MKSYRLYKHEKILKRADFVNMNKTGRRLFSRNFIIVYRQNSLGFTRLGITVTKKIGNAVKRNRIKRLVREFFRLNKSSLPKGYDIVIIAKKDVSPFSFEQIQKELQDAFDKEIPVS